MNDDPTRGRRPAVSDDPVQGWHIVGAFVFSGALWAGLVYGISRLFS